MITIEKLERMMELQDKMNSVINPDWKQAGNKWLRAAWIEAAELMDWVGYKWWKKQTPNIKQAQIELVDIWHFLLSQAIESGVDANELSWSFEEDEIQAYYMDSGSNSTLEWIEEFVIAVLEEGVYEDFYTMFAILCRELDLEFDELYRLYIGKNVLNIFRQDHGYKEGSYIKQWPSPLQQDSTIEDNVYLEMFMADAKKDQPEDLYEYIYKKLETEYAKAS